MSENTELVGCIIARPEIKQWRCELYFLLEESRKFNSESMSL